MSHFAMGWAQRQRLGDPVAKAVLSTMCYVMRDDTLAVYVGIPTLEEFTEYEDRAIRKAIARLVEIGVLTDTGMKKNNIPVYRIPGYETWLSGQNAGPPQDGRAAGVDLSALAQVADLTAQKKVGKVEKLEPSRKGEGSSQALPSSHSSPPALVPQALPLTGPNLGSDLKNLNPSAPAREIPSGSRGAQDRSGGLDPIARVWHWANVAWSTALGDAGLFGLIIGGQKYSVPRGTSPVELPARVADELKPLIRMAAEAAVADEIDSKLQYKIVDARLSERVKLEMKAYLPPEAFKRPHVREIAA